MTDLIEVSEEEWKFLYDFLRNYKTPYADHVRFEDDEDDNCLYFIEREYLISVITPITNRLNKIKRKCKKHD